MKQGGLDLAHWLLRKVTACLNFLSFSAKRQLLKLDFFFLKKKKNISAAISEREKILHLSMRKSQSPQSLPLPSSFLLRDEGLSPLIPNATLNSLALRCWGGARCTPSPRRGACCSRWDARPKGCTLAVAAGGKAVVWVWESPGGGEHATRSACPLPRLQS